MEGSPGSGSGVAAVYFSLGDYAVFASVLMISAIVGVFYAFKDRKIGTESGQKSTDNYLMGGRKMPLIPVALSLLVSFQSAILVLGASSEMYTRGSTYWWSSVGISFSCLLTCFVFVPVFYYLNLTSVYEYLEVRFHSKTVRRLGSGLYLLVTILYLSIAIYAPSVALSAVTPFPLWSLILIAGCICTFYVFLGGMKAVIWTDAIQAGFMLAGLVAVAVKGTLQSGGIGKVWESNVEAGRVVYFDPSLDPFSYMTSFGIIFGSLFSWLGWYGINQSSVQRYCGMKSVRHGQLALLLNIPGLFLGLSLVCYCGFVMYSYFASCDPLASGQVAEKDELLPFFVMRVLGHARGVPGLFLACLYSGTLSTVSSGLNSLSAVAWEDFLKEPLQNLSSVQAVTVTKLLCLLSGVLATCLSFLVPLLGGVLQAALSAMGAVNGPLTGLFLLGVTVPWANKKGACMGALVSGLFCLWIFVGAHVTRPHSEYLPSDTSGCLANATLNFTSTLLPFNETSWPPPPPSSSALLEATGAEGGPHGLRKLYALSFALYDLVGILLVIVVAVPVSWATGFEDVSRLNPKLFHPFLRRFVFYSPEKAKLSVELQDFSGKKEEERLTLDVKSVADSKKKGLDGSDQGLQAPLLAAATEATEQWREKV